MLGYLWGTNFQIFICSRVLQGITVTLCPVHTTGGKNRVQRFNSAVEPSPRTPHTFRDLVYHSHYRRYTRGNAPVLQLLSKAVFNLVTK